MRFSLALSTVSALALFATPALADDTTFTTRDTLGVDALLYYQPTSGDMDGGAQLRTTQTSSLLPSWMFYSVGVGLAGDGHRLLVPIAMALGVGTGNGPFAQLDFGLVLLDTNEDDRDQRLTVTDAVGVTAGLRIDHWQLGVGLVRNDAFAERALMFTLGRDFVGLDATSRRSTF